MTIGDVHTVPRYQQWFIEVEGDERATTAYDTKEEAAMRGRELAILHRSEHSIHGHNGTISEKHNYGHAPAK